MKQIKCMMLFTGLIFALLLTINPGAQAHPPQQLFQKWHKLGVKNVSFQHDRDVIFLSPSERKVSSIKIEVLNAPVHLHRCKIYYANGLQQTKIFMKTIGPGQSVFFNPHSGKKKSIHKIELIYDSKNVKKSNARVIIWGKH